MGDFQKLQYEFRDIEQELKIRTEQNAELYAKLCNALVQLNEANEILKVYGTPITRIVKADEKSIVTETIPYCDSTLAANYLKKYEVVK